MGIINPEKRIDEQIANDSSGSRFFLYGGMFLCGF